MTIQDFIPPPYTKMIENASVSYQSPSNIALVKYWGKTRRATPSKCLYQFHPK